jgi:ubiquinol-cytochrome c reductase cytochrome b subunit
MLHIWALHVPGNGNPTGVNVKSKNDTVPFHPYYTVKDVFGLSVFLILFAWIVFYIPNYLGHPDNYIAANPLKTPAHIVPEWYFLPFYAILRSIPNKLLGVIALFGSIAILLFLPWLDTSRVRSAVYRPIYRQFFWIFVLVTIGLGYLGSQPPEGVYVIIGRILTVYYFAHFLIILPVIGIIEKPKPLPASISDSVLAKHGQAPVAAGAK